LVVILEKMTVNSEVKIIKRYAESLFAVAERKKQRESVLKELYALNNAFNKISKQVHFINDPVYRDEIRLDFVAKINKVCKLSSIINGFLKVLAVKRRFTLLNDIYHFYHELYQISSNTKKVEIISAELLTKSEITSLEKFFVKNFKQNIWVDNKVNPDIIGGSVITIDEKVIDNSVFNKMNRLRLNLEESLAE